MKLFITAEIIDFQVRKKPEKTCRTSLPFFSMLARNGTGPVVVAG
jgi:hypothetical protein